MTQRIYSKLNPEQILVSILRPNQTDVRIDAADADQILQVSLLRLPAQKTIAPHRHLPQTRQTVGTSEAWVVVSGNLQGRVFDVDGTLLDTVKLTAGDCMVLYQGGHSFTVTTNNAVIYEIKNGPYRGPELDAEKIQ